MTMAPRKRSEVRITIGVLARATGIPAPTLRTWEDRYGYPVPRRGRSGYRRYVVDDIARLQSMARAIELGHRPSEVVGASHQALERLLGAGSLAPLPVAAAPREPFVAPVEALDLATSLDGDRVMRVLLADWAQLDVLDFLEERIAPLLRATGSAWQSGELAICHEHFLSERIGDLLRSVRLPFDQRARGRLAVLATLPADRHALGLQMAALVLSRVGWRVMLLGADLPLAEIARTARDSDAAAVGIGISPAAAPGARPLVTRLRRLLPRAVELFVGGGGVDASGRTRAGVEVLPDLRALDRWARR